MNVETNEAAASASASTARKPLVQTVTGRVTSDTVRLKSGTRLLRRWRGKAYHVLVLDDGFEHEGRHFVSLSQIARAITGAQWSGPRFFGLRKGGRSDG